MSWLWTFGKVPELTAPELLQLSQRVCALAAGDRQLATAPRIIDVRTAAEYADGHVEGAVNASFLPPWGFADRIGPLLRMPDGSALPFSTHIVVICLSAHRSIGALKWLREKGYTNVQQLAAGMKDWRARGLPEVKEQQQQQ